jgi:hypothetical protein
MRHPKTVTTNMQKTTAMMQKTSQQSNRLERESVEGGKMMAKAKSEVRQMPPLFCRVNL